MSPARAASLCLQDHGMTEWLRWTAPPAIVLSLASPVYATQYLTVEQAQKLAFPSATQFAWAPVVYRPDQVAAIEKRSGEKVMSRGEQVWKAENGNQFLGFFLVDYVIGKHLVRSEERRVGKECRSRWS